MNKVMLIGNLGKPALVKSSNGTTFCRLSLATNEKWKDKGGNRQERTDWHTVVAFGTLAKALEILDRGDRVAVVGKLRTSKYVKDGETRWSVEVHAEEVEFLKLRAWREEGEDAGYESDPIAPNENDLTF